MKVTLISLLTLALMTSCHGNQTEVSEAYLRHFIADLWLEGAEVFKIIWRDCSHKLVHVKDVIEHKENFAKFVRCTKRKTLRALDRSLSSDIVPIADGVNLVRFELVDGFGKTMPINSSSAWTDKELDEGEWRTLALQRIGKILHTHVLKFDLGDTKILDKVEYRGRRRHHMMTMMMFGIVSIGMVLVPMGFQFLAVLGGKALLLAKMALVLASIQGLKKIASSPVNYGFYHSYPYEHYERRSIDDLSLLAIMPPSPRPPTTVHSLWPNSGQRTEKFPRVQKEESKERTNALKRPSVAVAWTPNITKTVNQKTETKVFPVYSGNSHTESTVVDAPTLLVDFTTRPGEIQTDYTLELPYNTFRFQNP